MRYLRFGMVLAVCGVMAGSLRADDWPQWLGPQRDSVWREEGIVARFPETGLKERWRVTVSGGYAGPAVADGRVFVTDYVTSGDLTPNPNQRNKLEGKERILCLSAEDGRLLWKHEYPCTYDVSYPVGPRVTPTVDGPLLYTLGTMGQLVCLKAADGAVVWEKNLPQEYNTDVPQWGFCGHPLVDGDKLICLVGGEGSVAVAFHKKTGEELWRALSAREPGYSPPTMIEAGGTRQLLIWHADALNSLDPETGKVYWSEPLKPDYGMSIIPPRKAGNFLFVGAIVNKGLMLKLNDEKPAAGVLWEVSSKDGIGPSHAPPLLDGDYMYGVDRQGELRCVRLATGERLWSTTEPAVGENRANAGTAFLVKQQDRYFLFNELGELRLARLSPAGYEEISRAQILEPTTPTFGRIVLWSHPAFADRAMFARNDNTIVCVELGTDKY